MEKMAKGFNKDSADWRYVMIMQDGSVAGTTKAKGDDAVEFCIGCHRSAQNNDDLFFLPKEYRVSAKAKR